MSSEQNNIIQDTLLIDEQQQPQEVNHLKRAASVEMEESREAKAVKLEIATRDCANNVPHVLDTSKTEVDQEPSTEQVEEAVEVIDMTVNNNDTNAADHPENDAVMATTTTTEESSTEQSQQDQPQPPQQQDVSTVNEDNGNKLETAQQQQQQQQASTNNNITTTNNNNNNTILSMPNGPTPPPGLHLLSDPQQQQLIQSYVQAQGQDLANLTASSLAQAMVSPIAVPNLATNLLQQLQQGGNVITALPGPPQLPQPTSSSLHPQHGANGSPLSEDGPGGTKRSGGRNMSNDERRQRRLLRNRVAAKECRKKKKQHIHEMEEKIVHLEEENALLVKEVEELKAKLSLGSMQGSESYRLMKEVEELNAKLGLGHLTSGTALTAAAVLNASQSSPSPQLQQQQQQQQQDTTTSSSTSPPLAPQPPAQQAQQTTPHIDNTSNSSSNNMNTSTGLVSTSESI